MRNKPLWHPSKYIFNDEGRLIASRDLQEVGVESRLTADLTARFYDAVLKNCLYPKGSLLDLGCGKAPLYLIYKDLVKNITLMDWGNSLHPNPHLDVVGDLTERLPFNDNEFDVIILSDVLEHIPTPESLFAEISRVLAPGGTLLMNVPFMYWVHEAPYDFHRYTQFALRRLAENSNLHIDRLEVLGGGVAVLIDLLAKLLVRVPGGGLLAKALQSVAPRMIGQGLFAAPNMALAYGIVCSKPGIYAELK